VGRRDHRNVCGHECAQNSFDALLIATGPGSERGQQLLFCRRNSREVQASHSASTASDYEYR